MRIGDFEIREPLPDLKEPHALAILRPWIDVNSVGTLLLDGLEAQMEARVLGQLAIPGNFFDFTRYRPMLYFEEGRRQMKIPNATLSCAKREGGHDFIFLRLLEPHTLGETFVDSILKILRFFQVKRYFLLGSMYDAVPHTRPLIVSGRATGTEAEKDLKKAGVHTSNYEGPTTILNLVTQQALEMGIETATLVVSLPQYVNIDEDFLGKVRLMEILNLIYGIPIDKKDFEKASRQRGWVNQKVEANPELKKALSQLENIYSLRMAKKDGERMPGLSPEMEEIFWDSDGDDYGKA